MGSREGRREELAKEGKEGVERRGEILWREEGKGREGVGRRGEREGEGREEGEEGGKMEGGGTCVRTRWWVSASDVRVV